MAKIDEHVKVMMLKGETGANIKSIDKTATSGLVDTYTVTLTDGTKSNFKVTNGKDGKDGADFDTFEIGGRNLLLKSRTFGGFQNTEDITLSEGVLSFGTSGAISTHVDLHCSKSAVAFMHGKQVTVSYWVRVRNGLANVSDRPFTGVQMAVEYGDGTREYPSFTFSPISELATADSKWRMAHYTYKLKDVEVANVQVNFFKRGVTGTVDYSRPKLEIGTKPSDWTPAPEDKADVSALAGKADVSAIVPKASVEPSATASQTYGVGDYVVVNGTLKVVTAAIAKGGTFGASNTADTTVSGEIGKSRFKRLYSSGGWTVYASDWMVFISAVQIATGSGTWDTVQCPYVLPAKYRPSYTVYAAALTAVGESNTGYISVENDGKVYIGNMGGSVSSESRDASICYPVGI